MTILVRGEQSYFMGSRAFLLDDDRETASSWASSHIKSNPAIKWVLGRYAEADNPNSNGQAWELEDLRLARPTVDHAPMNLLHQPRNIVGAFTASEMIYPTDSADENGITNPYIEALGAFWKVYFPQELEVVQRAHDEGALFFSMECVAETVTFRAEGREEQTFPYRGPRHESYGGWNDVAGAERWFNKPHFIGGALIVPPTRPGWNKADIKSIAKYVEDHSEQAHAVYEQAAAEASHLPFNVLEQVTLKLMEQSMGEVSDTEFRKNSISVEGLSNMMEEENSRSQVSQGGDNMSDTRTYSEQELQAAIADAVAPLKAELDELTAKAENEAVDSRINELKTAHDTELASLQAQLDAKTAEAEAVKADKEDILAYLQAEADAVTAAAERAERLETRVTKVSEVANFSAEYIEENKERWADMDEASFDALVANVEAAIAAVSNKEGESEAGAEGASTTINDTAMNMERETAGAESKWSDFKSVGRLAVQGADFSTL